MIEECDALNKSILELTGTTQKDVETQQFVDLTITFSLKKKDAEAKTEKNGEKNAGEYEILKNVPDVRVCYGSAKSSKKQVTPVEKSHPTWPKYGADYQHDY